MPPPPPPLTPQAFFFKDRLGLGHNERLVAMMGTWTEGLVGVSLIAIGLLGLKESLLDYEEAPAFEAKSAGSAVVEGATPGAGGGVSKSGSGGKAIFFNGVLHGFSWDGAPSLAPALALSSWSSVLWFLLAYCSGTMVSFRSFSRGIFYLFILQTSASQQSDNLGDHDEFSFLVPWNIFYLFYQRPPSKSRTTIKDRKFPLASSKCEFFLPHPK